MIIRDNLEKSHTTTGKQLWYGSFLTTEYFKLFFKFVPETEERGS